MKNRFSTILVVFSVALFFSGCLSDAQPTTPRVCFGERCVLVEVADSPDERAKGLMYRESLPGNNGMLFVFEDESIHGFWMKNTLIPLDAVWINSRGEVVDTIAMSPCAADPCKVYSPAGDALYVLEVNSGLVQSWNIRRGDIVHIFGV